MKYESECHVTQGGKAPNSLPANVPELPMAHGALQKRLISSSVVPAISLPPIRERNSFTADIITASGSNRAGTNKPRLSAAGGGPREAHDESIYGL